MHVIARDYLRLITLLFELKTLNLVPTKYPAIRLKILSHFFKRALKGQALKA
jgi:hypothetical protein